MSRVGRGGEFHGEYCARLRRGGAAGPDCAESRCAEIRQAHLQAQCPPARSAVEAAAARTFPAGFGSPSAPIAPLRSNAMIARSDIAGGKVSQAYRAAKLALLRIQAHQTIERTDAS